jgi:hypothetical protein
LDWFATGDDYPSGAIYGFYGKNLFSLGDNNDLEFRTYAMPKAESVQTFGNSISGSTVPEPSTWAMMLVGFAGLAYAGYRASRKSASAAA